jgi:hypothetical protein
MHMVCTLRRGEKHAAEVLNNGRSARSIVLRSGYSLAGYSVVLLRSVCSEPVFSCFTMITNNFITFKSGNRFACDNNTRLRSTALRPPQHTSTTEHSLDYNMRTFRLH